MSTTVPTVEDHRYNVSVELTVINCGICAGTYAINERRRVQCEQEGTAWNCPYCQTGWGYSHNNENSRLKDKLKTLEREKGRLQKEKEWAEQSKLRAYEERAKAERKARAQKGLVTRLKKRVAGGACPCCHQRFKNLEAHMSAKHPDYAKGEGDTPLLAAPEGGR